MAHYYSIPGGGVAFREQEPSSIPAGWTEITEGAYDTQLSGIEAANDALKQANADAASDAREHAYNVLTASTHTADWDDATIRLITGWDG